MTNVPLTFGVRTGLPVANVPLGFGVRAELPVANVPLDFGVRVKLPVIHVPLAMERIQAIVPINSRQHVSGTLEIYVS